ncbi:hypothetical protein BU23DRAFT_491570 [Bimuria novae-zelandiae CBS 107.79]|uniref:DUF676 domain-containing protein n=1 Tax=Bimuria novae-zelandiae CBS 107.79 TaxID=1447943 RepID=A0A6A5UJD1_9PLEO|nr:hypothetical protein BU23DRAFT_491570 [Bimuria novae-zelandiae CBS 107.79]
MFWRDPYDPHGTETYEFFNPVLGQDIGGPFQQFFRDVINLIWNFRLVPFVLWPPFTRRQTDELYLFSWSFLALIWFFIWSLVQFPIVLTVLLSLVFVIALVGLLTWVHSLLFWKILHGPLLQVYPPNMPSVPRGLSVSPIDGQRWIYINGIATGKTLLRQNIELLSRMFNRPILGINNRSYGFLGDLVECVLQRSFGFRTAETRIAFPIIRDYLHDTTVDRVVFIAHSQGGIIASHILDDLYTSVSKDDLQKLEVYTFGSTALHFNNPPNGPPPSPRVLAHIEHYCNKLDLGATGHLLNQYYLSQWFGDMPGPAAPQQNSFMSRSVVQDPVIANKFRVPQTIL